MTIEEKQEPRISFGSIFVMFLMAAVLAGMSFLVVTRKSEASTNLIFWDWIEATQSAQPPKGARQTATPQIPETPGAQVTPQSSGIAAEVGGGVVAVATATPVQTTEPVSNPYLQAGVLAINDPLIDNSQGYGWDQGANSNNAHCLFTDEGLEVTQPKSGYFHSCIARSANLTSFVYEVRMRQVTGSYGGLIFGADATQGVYYIFSIRAEGTYSFRALNHDQYTSTLSNGRSEAINVGPNANNLLAVAVQQGMIKLYVNHQLIATVRDTSAKPGNIGVFAGNDGRAAELVFSDARVWKLG